MNGSVLLNESTVIPYLQNRHVIGSNEIPKIEILTGGISNIVLGISAAGKEMVLKQALPELMVPSTWRVEQRRTTVEARAMDILHHLTPRNVPVLIDVDPEHFVLIMLRASRNLPVWKDELLAGRIEPEVAANLGKVLGFWHRTTAKDDDLLEEFIEDELFEQLRISPFYREVASQHSVIKNRVNELIGELEYSRQCLVHGDFSPKNILASETSNVVVLDFEVAHTGNPVFDPAFLLAHLLCKSIHFSETAQKKAIADAALAFIESYEKTLGNSAGNTLGWHVATIALSRVDGISRVHYLSTAAQNRVRAKTIEILTRSQPPSISEIFALEL